MSEELEEPYEKVESWGQAVKGDEAFADRSNLPLKVTFSQI